MSLIKATINDNTISLEGELTRHTLMQVSKKAIESSSALGLITMPKVYPEAYFEGGRVIQKIWLGATEKGVSFQPLSLSTFLSERIADGNFEGLEDVKDKIIHLYARLKSVCEI